MPGGRTNQGQYRAAGLDRESPLFEVQGDRFKAAGSSDVQDHGVPLHSADRVIWTELPVVRH